MSQLTPGKYLIINVAHKRPIGLRYKPDPPKPVVSLDPNDSNKIWNIKSDGKFTFTIGGLSIDKTIQGVSKPILADSSNPIPARWIIEGKPGDYTIRTLDGLRFWTLDNAQNPPKVTLKPKETASHWDIVYHSSAAAIQLADGKNRIYYLGSDGALHESYRDSPSGAPNYDRILVPFEKVRGNTPIAATTWGTDFSEIRVYYISPNNLIHELCFTKPSTDFVVGLFDAKKYMAAPNSKFLYAISINHDPRVGFQSADAPTSITEAAYTLATGWRSAMI